MAKTSKNVLGDQQGKIGKVVGRVVNGVQLYSAYVVGSNRNTPKQRAQRTRFGAATMLSYALSGAINMGFRRAASSKPMTSSRNVFVKKNMTCITADIDTSVATIDYEHITVSEGRVPEVSFASASFTEAGKVTVPFTANTDNNFGAFEDDSVYVIAYAPDLKKSVMTMVSRDDETATITLPSVWTGKTIHLWGFVKTSVEETVSIENAGLTLHPNDCSDSYYIGSGVVS